MQEAYKLYKTYLPGDHDLQQFCCRCGIEMVNEARIKFKKDGDKVVSMARDVEKQAATVSDEVKVW